MNSILKNDYEVEHSDNIINYSLIRNMLRSIGRQHWSVLEAMDEYDIPEDQRDIYMETIAEEFFVS